MWIIRNTSTSVFKSMWSVLNGVAARTQSGNFLMIFRLFFDVFSAWIIETRELGCQWHMHLFGITFYSNSIYTVEFSIVSLLHNRIGLRTRIFFICIIRFMYSMYFNLVKSFVCKRIARPSHHFLVKLLEMICILVFGRNFWQFGEKVLE